MSKKRPKFKNRHKFNLAESMLNERRIRDNLIRGIWGRFADQEERTRYINGLIAGLDHEIEIANL